MKINCFDIGLENKVGTRTVVGLGDFFSLLLLLATCIGRTRLLTMYFIYNITFHGIENLSAILLCLLDIQQTHRFQVEWPMGLGSFKSGTSRTCNFSYI